MTQRYILAPTASVIIVCILAGCVMFQEGPYGRVYGPIDGVELVSYHYSTFGWSDYLANNTTSEIKCYRLRHGDIDIGWHDLPALIYGKKYATGKQFIRINNIYNIDNKTITIRPFSGMLVVMPYPRIGTCSSYNGVVEMNSVTQEWFFDADKVAIMLQRPVSEIERELSQKGMIPLTPISQKTTSSALQASASSDTQVRPTAADVQTYPTSANSTSPSTAKDLEKGYRGMLWGANLSEFKAKFPKHSEENSWWITGEGIEEFAGLWMKTRYGFNKHERLSTVEFLPNQEDRSRVVQNLIAILGQPTNEKEGNSFWTLKDRNVTVAALFKNGVIVIQHGPLSKD